MILQLQTAAHSRRDQRQRLVNVRHVNALKGLYWGIGYIQNYRKAIHRLRQPTGGDTRPAGQKPEAGLLLVTDGFPCRPSISCSGQCG
ncbi:hypothetical protein GDO78_019771 [Eleutherodactylus coqui]|uniref:Uncharacterized protein n=1 Tax=Eleutherodactylus coqui TaxID=57060 RepID=A0A8J6B7F6_ELECQ|nr:hypothetical protein GDO78_019771 [Eleutherodactylus coqui]